MFEIKCINKEDRDNPFESITHIWWVNPNWTNWKITQKEAINYIKTSQYQFYVSIGLRKVDVIVSKSRFWHEYIKTSNDWEEPNNLLSLRECIY